MAERTINYRITAKDEASGVFSRFSRNLQKSMQEAEVASGKIIGPTTINRQMLSSTRTTEEQAVRDLMANRIKGMRRAAAEERIKAIAEEKLFGSQLSAAMRQTNQRVAKELTGLDKLKSVLGARGSVKNVAELFVGGGAIAAVGFITHSIANAARNARELTDEFRDGKIQAGEFADKLVGTIPVLGSIWRAGRDIREMITGEQRLIVEATKEAELFDQVMKSRVDVQKKSNDAAKEHLEIIRNINREMKLRFMPEPGRSVTEAGFASGDERRATNDRIQKAKDDLQANTNELIRVLTSARTRQQNIMQGITPSMLENDLLGNVRSRFYSAKAEIEKIDAELSSQSTRLTAELAKLESQRVAEVALIEKNGAAERRKILIDAGKAQVEEWVKQGVKILDAGKEVQKRMEEQEQKHQENIRRTRDETFRRYMSQYNAAMRMAEGEFRKSAPGRGTATPVEVRFATRVGSPEDSVRRTSLDELRKSANAAVNTQRLVNDILLKIQTMTGIGQAQYEVFGNN